MFEAIIYDERDLGGEHPGSIIGTFEFKIDAWDAIARHLERFSEQCEFVYKAEVKPEAV